MNGSGAVTLHRRPGFTSKYGAGGPSAFSGAVELLPRVLNGGAVLARPRAEPADRFQQRAPQPGELVIDARWNRGEHRARDQPVALERAQGERQHALRDAPKRAAQFVEALRPRPERRDDQHGPLVA